MRHFVITLFTMICAAMFVACGGSNKGGGNTADTVAVVGPSFSADTAMAMCQAQCDFGPRTMNSTAHDRCGKWIADKFAGYGLAVDLQRADLKGWDGTILRSTNIIARYNPAAERRILICAHWDCRPWADNDPDEANHRTPVMAANDGASGVGVMLELARLLSADTTLTIGIDFVCFDAEDYGVPQWAEDQVDATGDTWALGAQYFAARYGMWLSERPEGESRNPAEWGILLDMVGGQGSHFYHEGLSLHYAPTIVDKVWSAAAAVGYGNYFLNQAGGMVTDDHKPLNEVGIPTIDIIPYFPDCEASSFGPTWHTVNDDMQHLDPAVLKAVGQTLIQLIYSEGH